MTGAAGRLVLRDYQTEAVEAVERAWEVGGLQRPAYVLPTGAGKTLIFAEQVRRWLAAERRSGGSRRALVLAHREELIEQAAAKLHDAAPDLRLGIVKASRNQTLADVVVASVPTLARPNRRRQLLGVGLVVVDEAHHAAAPSYLAVLDHLGCWREAGEPVGWTRAVGCTATMVRGDKKALGDVWQDIVFERSTAWMVEHGYLVRPRGVRVRVADLDLRSVKRSRGDYAEGDLGRALEGSLAPEAVVKAYREHAGEPSCARQGILFAPTVRTTELFAAALTDAGYSAASIFGHTPAEERTEALNAFRAGTVQILCNCMVLTEGTDLPMASVAVIARPTTNNGLYVQMVGRVLRLWPGKPDALVLDVVGASARNTLRSQVDLFGERSAELPDDDEVELNVDVEQLDDGEIVLDGAGDAFGADDPSWLNGPLTAEIVDLFHGSASAWQRTRAGVWFLPAGERYIAIVRAPAERGRGYDVLWCHRYRRGESDWIINGVSDLSYAMAYAEANVTTAEAMTARKERAWRAKPASDKQKDLARRLGIVVNGQHSGELSQAITYESASRRIDPYLTAWMRG